MIRLARILILPALSGAMLVAAAYSPRVLRHVDTFAVARIEVTGHRFMNPRQVLDLTGIAAGANIFDDPRPWRAALTAYPLIADARIERRLLSTLWIHLTEVEPVALARTPELRPVAADGTLLPLDVTVAGLDLPVLASVAVVDDDGRLAGDAARAAVAALAALAAADPELAAAASEVEPIPGGGVRLRLSSPRGLEVWITERPGAVELERIRLAMADLAGRGELERARRVDARFRDQVVVSLNDNRGR